MKYFLYFILEIFLVFNMRTYESIEGQTYLKTNVVLLIPSDFDFLMLLFKRTSDQKLKKRHVT